MPDPAPRTVRFVTFGCKVNQYDTQVLRERAERAGLTEVEGPADLIVVNTCTVTQHGAAVARKAVRGLARECPDARIVVTGCYASSDPEEAAALPNVAAVVPHEDKGDLLAELLGGEGPRPFIEERVAGHSEHTRAFVKVEDGCPLHCSYCIVSTIRSRVESKRPGTAVEEVRALVRGGHREIVLTGVHLGAWGRDLPNRPDLATLVRRLLGETGIERIRLSSIEAQQVTPEIEAIVAEEPRIAPHLHLPLQSGSAAVLERMRRRTTPDAFLATAARLRERVPDLALSTDVIVGFPGETDDDFAATLSVMAEAGFMRTHVFPFSRRPGTPAASMPAQVPAAVIRRRAAEARDAAASLGRDFLERLRGHTALALVERRREPGRLEGLTGRYVRVFLRGAPGLAGRMVRVRLGAIGPRGMEAEVLLG